MKTRIDYIDLIKGITIFGVVWVHTCHYDWLTPTLVNSIFFFISGFFFKRRPFKEFLRVKVNTMLIPFSFFYILSYPFRIIFHYWDNRTLDTFDWGCIGDIFNISTRTDYLFVNVPLWFIICLFVIQVIYYFISYLNKLSIAILAILCFALKDYLYSTPTPLMINAAFYYMGFFMLGNLFGKPWMEKLKDKCFRTISSVLSLLFIALIITVNIEPTIDWLAQLVMHVKLFIVLFTLISIASWFDNVKHLAWLRFWGKNSLTILGLHIMPLIVIRRIFMKLFNDCTPLMGLVHSLICMAILYVIILLCNKYIPRLVGKSK